MVTLTDLAADFHLPNASFAICPFRCLLMGLTALGASCCTGVLSTTTGIVDSRFSLGVSCENSDVFRDYLRFRRESPSAPYNIQSFTELRSADNDYSIANAPGSILKPADCEKVNYMFTTQALYEQCGKAGIYKQDGGYLMKDFRKWAETENTQPIIFVYAYNDPWTGGGISDEAVSKNPNILVKVVDGLATHADSFLHRELYTKDSETKIVNALNKFLKLK